MLAILDLLLGCGYWLLGLIVVNGQMGPRGVVSAAATVAAVSVAVCRRWVVLGYLVALIGQLIALVHLVSGDTSGSYWLAFLATPPMAYALFRISARHRLRWAVVGWLPALAYPIAVLVVSHSIGPVFPIPLVLAPVLPIGYAERRRHQEMVGYHAGLADIERDRARLAVTEERIRIVRELHDVVSHGMSVITVQAGSGRLVIDERPQEAEAALEAIETTSRQMLVEMRQMLGVLRADGGPPPIEPVPGLADLDELTAQLARARVRVEVIVSGQASVLPPGIDVAAYRILQEALTNVARHAETDTCRVNIGYGSEAVTIEILDDGRGSSARCTGLGLTGMRERAQACGGRLEAHPLPGRGFRVAAWLPLPTDAPSTVTATTPAATDAPAGKTQLRTLASNDRMDETKSFNPRRVLLAAFSTLAIGVGTFLLLVLTVSSWASYEVKDGCREARSTYGGDCVEALARLLDDEHRSFRSRNDAIGALGWLRDPRALPALERYYTGVIPPREPLDQTISQYELRKSVRLLKGETKTFLLFWQYEAD
jgi:signal transduction histidine kinase